MKNGGLYVRGFGGSLFWSDRKDVGALSRSDLEQVDLGAISLKPTGAQAVIDSWRCAGCGMIAFKAQGADA
jgi:hypothetical protein